MRRRVKYKLPVSKATRSNFLYLLAILVLAVFVAWLWWNAGKGNKKTIAARSAVVAQAPVAPAQPKTNAVTPTPIAPAPPRTAAAAQGAWPRSVQNVFEAQLALLKFGISSGSLDGAIGPQTRAALATFQARAGLPATSELDPPTKAKLLLDAAPYTAYAVTPGDLARVQPLAATWLGKSQQSALDFESVLELVAEKTFSHPNLIRQLNPGINWTSVAAGTILQVPAAVYPAPPAKAAFVTIHLGGKTLEAFDSATNLLAHFPCSIARLYEKRPVGELHVANLAPNPNYTFDPAVFPESPEARQLTGKFILPPGPNNPVGVAWIGLDRPGYGIHGTPSPEQVGRTESHGCFRLANWNAEYLLRMVTVGTPVYVVE